MAEAKAGRRVLVYELGKAAYCTSKELYSFTYKMIVEVLPSEL